jgi:hypothetical protein
MLDNSKELQGMTQLLERQPQESKHKEMVDSCCHKQQVEKDMPVPQ